MVVSGIEIEIVTKNIKNMHLVVLPPDGKVRISAPCSMNEEAIKLFAISKIGWVKQQIEKYQNQLRQSKREYVTGESHYVWGKRYRMEILHTNGNTKVALHGNKLTFTVHPDSTPEQRATSMNEWYRRQLRAKFPELFSKWESIIGVHAEDIKIKDMLTRWGTCNVEEKRIWLNLQLAKKPPECLEYVIVHELMHLKEKSHNAQFISLMDGHLPDWRLRKEKLNSFIMDRYIAAVE